MVNLSDDVRKRLADDFSYYAPRCLKIRTKSGQVGHFQPNKAQSYIHAKLEDQLQKTGKVRALILKGRQQGCSTYVSARYYHQVTHRLGCQVFILTHEAEATDNLFNIPKRYHDNLPAEIKLKTLLESSRALVFDGIDSGYKVGTAGNKRTGRSSTIQLFHGSEVAFWDNDREIMAGALQAVSDEEGTEVILESTANGVGNMYYEMCMDALRGEGDYQLVFVPWFWQDEYQKKVPEGVEFTPEEREYARLYTLSPEQLYWRRIKTKELGSEWMFMQEYPATAVEAFQVSGQDSFIKAQDIMNARKSNVHTTAQDPLILGVDPARYGEDRSAIIWRKGRKQYKHEVAPKQDLMALVGRVHQIILEDNPDAVFVDIGGLGAGVYDRLIELGHRSIVRSVNFGSKALNDAKYKNKRIECWGLLREWIEEGINEIEDDDAMQADLIAPTYTHDSNNRIVLERKEDMKKRGLKSTDLGDALALTFAQPVVSKASRSMRYQLPNRKDSRGSATHFVNM